jgi:hypothetical protein
MNEGEFSEIRNLNMNNQKTAVAQVELALLATPADAHRHFAKCLEDIDHGIPIPEPSPENSPRKQTQTVKLKVSTRSLPCSHPRPRRIVEGEESWGTKRATPQSDW